MNFLLIDDQREVVRPLRGVLESHFRRDGIRLFHCSNISDGIKEAKSDSGVVLVLLDLGMPCVNGPAEAVECIKKFPQPVVCYTAHDDHELRQRASDLGSAGFILKSEDWDVQLAQLDEIVKQIKSARIRTKTEANEGMQLRRRPSLGFLAAAASIIVILSFCGGALATAYSLGGIKQTFTNDIANTKAQAEEIKQDVAKVKASHDTERKEDQQVIHRMDIGLKLVMAKLGITPPRDGE